MTAPAKFDHDGLFQIGTVCRCCGVTRKTLLFYESKGLLHPASVNEVSGYRYYSIEDVTDLMQIIQFRCSGLSIAEIAEYVKGGRASLPDVISTMEAKLASLQSGLETMRSLNIDEGDYTVFTTSRPAQRCFVKSYHCTCVEEAEGFIYDTFREALTLELNVCDSYNIFAQFDNGFLTGQPLDLSDFLLTVCVPVSADTHHYMCVDFPPVSGIYVHHRGQYSDIGRAYEAIYNYVNQNGLEPSGSVREYYLESGRGSKEADGTVTKVFLPIK